MTQLPEGLPELPQPDMGGYGSLDEREHVNGHSDGQMRAYGLACYQAGLERAAQLVESQKFWEIIPELAADSECADVAGAVMNSMMFAPVAAAIRAEKPDEKIPRTPA